LLLLLFITLLVIFVTILLEKSCTITEIESAVTEATGSNLEACRFRIGIVIIMFVVVVIEGSVNDLNIIVIGVIDFAVPGTFSSYNLYSKYIKA
jgi:hypothetical protein